jgi:hypothetical protein
MDLRTKPSNKTEEVLWSADGGQEESLKVRENEGIEDAIMRSSNELVKECEHYVKELELELTTREEEKSKKSLCGQIDLAQHLEDLNTHTSNRVGAWILSLILNKMWMMSRRLQGQCMPLWMGGYNKQQGDLTKVKK